MDLNIVEVKQNLDFICMQAGNMHCKFSAFFVLCECHVIFGIGSKAGKCYRLWLLRDGMCEVSYWWHTARQQGKELGKFNCHSYDLVR